MSTDAVSEQSRFAAREFLARWMRETGETPMPIVADRMLFAFEIGYMRGRTDGAQASMAMMDKISSVSSKEEEGDDDGNSK